MCIVLRKIVRVDGDRAEVRVCRPLAEINDYDHHVAMGRAALTRALDHVLRAPDGVAGLR
jgi:hypothetical protein